MRAPMRLKMGFKALRRADSVPMGVDGDATDRLPPWRLEVGMTVAPLEVRTLAQQVWSATDALVLLVDEAELVLAANPAICRALGLEEQDLIGRDATAAVVPREVPDLRAALRGAIRAGLPFALEHELPRADGLGRRSVAWSISRVSESPVTVACIGVDVTATRDEFEVLRNRAVTDELTGLPNRAGLLEQLSSLAGSGATVVFCDLNGFKLVNDTHGHAAGDSVLVQIARRLTRTVRGEDFVARLGGDEFVIVVPPDPHSDFEALARRLLRATDQPMILPGPIVATVGMSIGMAVLEHGADPATVLTAADHNMYLMKSRQTTRASSVADAERADDR
jgi:diguanylate cyclase (GGDEF)-like protein/PAS domain S-box-containing protein